jgi:UDP-3-O-[3-hydroxymyristoyl] N-acetylglucosamine deacetylase
VLEYFLLIAAYSGGHMRQTTIARRIQCSGIGLHSGKKATLTLRPASEETGIVFHVASPTGKKTIRPCADSVIATGLATTLGQNGASVSTVEHLLAALRGLAIDNVHVDVDGGEIPIMDGSAAPFAMLLAEAGTYEQNAPRKVYRIMQSIRYGREDKFISAEPYNGFSVDCAIVFPHPCIGAQRKKLDLTPRSFLQVAKARTFGFLQDVDMLKARGLALGGSLDNAVVLDERGVLNEEGLRYPDEFVRHKLLDFIGDMAMLPLPLQGRFTIYCSGHSLNNDFLRHISRPGSCCLETVTLGDERLVPFKQPARRHERGARLPALAAS